MQTSWLFTRRSGGVELRTTLYQKTNQIEWQSGGFEPGTSRFQIQHPFQRYQSD